MEKTELIKILNEWKEEIKINLEKNTKEFKNYLGDLLDEKINETKKKVDNIEREMKMRNIIIQGLEEGEENINNLETKVINFIKEKLYCDININQIDYIKRIGKPNEGKIRPILVAFLAFRIRNIILKNKKKIKGTPQYVTEDFPKEVMITRKKLIPELIKAREQGKFAIIKYDKLIIKGKINDYKIKDNNKKRPLDISPTQTMGSHSKKTDKNQEKLIKNKISESDEQRGKITNFLTNVSPFESASGTSQMF